MLRRSTGCSLGDYLVIERGGILTAVASKWDQSAGKRTIVEEHSRATASLAALSKAGSVFGILRKLPQVAEPLRILQVRHFACRPGCERDLRLVLKEILRQAWAGGFHVVQASVPDRHRVARLFGSPFAVRVPLVIYCGSVKGERVLEGLKGRPCYEDVSFV